MIGGANLKRPGKERKLTWSRDWKINKWLYFLAIPIFLYFFIFNYLPMFGLVIAFQDFKPQLGVFGSKLVGWKNFETFFGGPNFLTILRNTLVISGLGLVFTFPLTIIYHPPPVRPAPSVLH